MKKLALILAFLACGAASAPAALITYNGTDANRGRRIDFKVDGQNKRYFAGVYDITIDSTLDTIAMCVELFKTIGPDTYNLTTAPPSSINSGARISWLVENFLQLIDTQDGGAGLQLALWDLVHDGGDGFAAGRVRSNNSTNLQVLSIANRFLSASNGQSSNGAVVLFTNNIDNGKMRQTLITGGPTPGGDQVPEPGTVILIGSALLAAGLLRRRRRPV